MKQRKPLFNKEDYDFIEEWVLDPPSIKELSAQRRRTELGEKDLTQEEYLKIKNGFFKRSLETQEKAQIEERADLIYLIKRTNVAKIEKDEDALSFYKTLADETAADMKDRKEFISHISLMWQEAKRVWLKD